MPDIYSSTNSNRPNPLLSGPEILAEAEKKVFDGVRDFLPSKRGHSLSSFIVLPSDGVRFETQEPEEKILMILRAHWVTNIPWFLISLILFLAPFVLRYFPLLDSLPPRYQLMFVVVWYLILLMYSFEKFLSWFFNMSIITDERIIDVNFYNLTQKKVSDADLDKIQDVTYTNSGFFGAVFDYGNVLVQTAAEMVEFVFDRVPHPSKVADILQRLRTEEKVEALEGRVR